MTRVQFVPRFRTVLRRLAAAAGMALGVVLVLSSPSHATLSPQCDASATLRGDDFTTRVNAKTTSRVKIPRKADVNYNGSIRLPAGEQYSYAGRVKLKLAIGNVEAWSWSGDTDKVQTAGTDSYDLDLPAGLLGGVKGKASGSHTQGGVTCVGSVNVEIEGSPVNAGSVASAAVTAAGAAGLVMAARGKPV